MGKQELYRKQAYCRNVCKAWCCKHLVFQYKEGDDEIERFFKLRDIEYTQDTGQLIVKSRCKWLSHANKCRFYYKRPLSCKYYECDILKEMEPLHYVR